MQIRNVARASRQVTRLLRSVTFLIVAFASTLLGVVWFATYWQVVSDQAAQQRDNVQEVANLAIVFEQNVSRTVGEIDRILMHLRETSHRTPGGTNWPTLIAGRHLADRNQLQIAVTNEKGMMIATSLGDMPAKPVDLSDREHVKAHLVGRSDNLFISKPVIGRVSLKAAVQLTRPYFTSSGNVGGVLVVSLDPAYLSKIYGAINLGEGSGLALIGTDDIVRAGTGAFEGELGKGLREATLNGDSLGAHNGTAITISRTNGDTRVIGMRAISDFPLSVIVKGRDLTSDPSLIANRRSYLIGAGILTLIVVFTSLLAITNRQRYETQIAQLVRNDSLTELANRSWFRHELDRVLGGLGDSSMVALHLIDLDRLKTVNDTQGHPVGDALLVAVAKRLQKTLRADDLPARLGGDEFAVLQRGVRSEADAAALARRICQILGESYEVAGVRLDIGASVGVSIATKGKLSGKDILVCADLALYAAKADGGNGHRIYDESLKFVVESRRALETDLRLAIVRNQLELHYQPILNAEARETIGFEALLRWRHHERGMISPAEFIPLAEETGLIVPIGEWVLMQACSDMVQRKSDIRVAVNLSPAQFRGCDVVAMVERVLAATGLAPGRLELEITESTLMQKDGQTIDQLRTLRDLGIKIAMDDFGTGYSSLSYLQSYPIASIKIDRSFVNGLGKDKSALSIIRAIIALANSLEMSTVAEGVETAEQFEQLRTLGCCEVQGFFFSKPGPAALILPPVNVKQTRELADADA